MKRLFTLFIVLAVMAFLAMTASAQNVGLNIAVKVTAPPDGTGYSGSPGEQVDVPGASTHTWRIWQGQPSITYIIGYSGFLGGGGQTYGTLGPTRYIATDPAGNSIGDEFDQVYDYLSGTCTFTIYDGFIRYTMSANTNVRYTNPQITVVPSSSVTDTVNWSTYGEG
jgi:hypothetical protein